MKILFVHGLGATRYDFFPGSYRLRKLGHATSTLSYFASFQSLDSIRRRLQRNLEAMASAGEYAVVGHSLGGVLLREALLRLAPAVQQPKHLFLLASPILAPLANQYLSRYALYKLFSGECGQLVSSPERMREIGLPAIPTTCVVGTKSFPRRFSPFGNEPNDGIVLESELCLPLFSDLVRIPARHPALPFSSHLAPIIHARLSSGSRAIPR